jgi:hypothetical protein
MMTVWDSRSAAEFQEKLTGQIPDDVVRAKTGRGWEEWAMVLAPSRALEDGFNATIRFLRHEYGISTWWANIIAARFRTT